MQMNPAPVGSALCEGRQAYTRDQPRSSQRLASARFPAPDAADRKGNFTVLPAALERTPGLAKHGLETRRQDPVLPERFVSFLHRREPAAPGESACPMARRVLRAGRLEVT